MVPQQTGPASVNRAIAAVLAEVTRLGDCGVTARELEEGKASTSRSLVLSMEEQMGLAFVLRDTELCKLGLVFPQTFPRDIRAVTAGQVQAAARKYIHPDRLIQIVATLLQP